jgi:hypothetical protein
VFFSFSICPGNAPIMPFLWGGLFLQSKKYGKAHEMAGNNNLPFIFFFS